MRLCLCANKWGFGLAYMLQVMKCMHDYETASRYNNMPDYSESPQIQKTTCRHTGMPS
jgi:hypothetical protein